MKTSFLKSTKYLNLPRVAGLAILLLGATFTACENGCKPGSEPEPVCSEHVTVVAAGCAATGEFKNLWLQLDNGELLQPLENKTAVTYVQAGHEFLVGYETTKAARNSNGQTVCAAMPPKGTPVRLLCMTPLEVPSENCATYVTARTVECSLGAWGNTWLQLDNGHYLQPWNNATGTQTLTAGARYKIGYTQMARDNRYANIGVCAAMPADTMAWNPEIVSVTCLELVSGN